MVRLQEIGQTRVAVVAHQIEQLCRSGTLLRMLQLAKKILYGARKKVSRHLLAAGAEALHKAHAKVRPRDQARGVETRLKASEFERAIVAHVHQVQGDLYSTERARDDKVQGSEGKSLPHAPTRCALAGNDAQNGQTGALESCRRSQRARTHARHHLHACRCANAK